MGGVSWLGVACLAATAAAFPSSYNQGHGCALVRVGERYMRQECESGKLDGYSLALAEGGAQLGQSFVPGKSHMVSFTLPLDRPSILVDASAGRFERTMMSSYQLDCDDQRAMPRGRQKQYNLTWEAPESDEANSVEFRVAWARGYHTVFLDVVTASIFDVKARASDEL